MTEPDPAVEASGADIAEQRREIAPEPAEMDPPASDGPPPAEADPADAADQRAVVERDDPESG